MADDIKIDGLDHLVEQIQRGSQASGSKDWLDNYIWVNVVRKVVAFTNCQPDFGEMMRYKAEIAALIRMAQDLRRDMFQAKEAAERLKKAYGERFETEGMSR